MKVGIKCRRELRTWYIPLQDISVEKDTNNIYGELVDQKQAQSVHKKPKHRQSVVVKVTRIRDTKTINLHRLTTAHIFEKIR